MATFHQKLDNVKDSLSSLFKHRRRRSVNITTATPAAESATVAAERNLISTPQNVKRVMHITFDAGRRSFDGIPEHWLPYFQQVASNSAPTVTASPAATQLLEDDSGVSMATTPTIEKASAAASGTPGEEAAVRAPIESPEEVPAPKELISLTYDRESGAFVDLPPHWRDRLERNNLLAPEFQRNPDLLVAVFALMDEELRAMSQEGFCLDRDLYSSSPAPPDAQVKQRLKRPADCQFVYEIEADRSNASSERDLQPDGEEDEEDVGAYCELAAPAAGSDLPQTFSSGDMRQPSLVRVRAVQAPSLLQTPL